MASMTGRPPPSQPTLSPRRLNARWPWFAAWFVVGVGYGVSFVGAASIGLFVLPLPVLATVLLGRWRSARGGLPGLICGVAVPLLYVGLLNRSGPATICTTTTNGGQSCVDEGSPWPWLAVAATLLVVGISVFIVRGHRRGH